MYALLHEVGHYYFRDPRFAESARERVLEWFDGPTAPENATSTLKEEAFCDLFAAANTITEFQREGYDARLVMGLVRWVRASIYLAYMSDERVRATYAGETLPEDLSGHDLMVRHACVNALIEAEMAERPPADVEIKYRAPFDAPDALLFQAFAQASTYETRNPGIRRMAGFMVDAMESGRDDPFEHILENFFQTWRLKDGKPTFEID